jgi:hypothetical protein
MKTEEDEAFDDLAKRQGDWGGGFKAKQAMAADKMQEQDWETLPPRVALNEELTKLMTDSYDQGVKDALESVKEVLDALPKREWVGLTDDEVMEMMGYDKQYGHIPQYARNFVEAISAKLKEKNG